MGLQGLPCISRRAPRTPAAEAICAGWAPVPGRDGALRQRGGIPQRGRPCPAKATGPRGPTGPLPGLVHEHDSEVSRPSSSNYSGEGKGLCRRQFSWAGRLTQKAHSTGCSCNISPWRDEGSTAGERELQRCQGRFPGSSSEFRRFLTWAQEP